MKNNEEELDFETKKQLEIIKSLYHELNNRPITAYENIDLNARTFEGKDLPENATLAIIMASEPNVEGATLEMMKAKEPNLTEKPNLLAKVLRTYPKHIKSLDLKTEIVGDYADKGLNLEWIFAFFGGFLLKEILTVHPDHARTLNLNKTYTPYKELTIAFSLVKINYDLFEKILLDYPDHMKNIDLSSSQLIDGNAISLANQLAEINIDLLEKIISHNPSCIKNVHINKPISFDKEKKNKGLTLASLLTSKGKTNIISKILLETDQKVSINKTEVFAELYSNCRSLDELHDLMRNYSKSDLKSLSFNKQTNSIANVCLIHRIESKINILFEKLKMEDQLSDKIEIISQILLKTIDNVNSFKNIIGIIDNKFKDYLVLKMVQIFSIIKEIYKNHSQEFLSALTTINYENLLHYTYSSCANFYSPKNLPIDTQLKFEINSYYFEANSRMPEYDNYFIEMFINSLQKENQHLEHLHNEKSHGKKENSVSGSSTLLNNSTSNSTSYLFYDKIILSESLSSRDQVGEHQKKKQNSSIKDKMEI